MQRGKLVILFILLMGILAGILSVWTHYRGGRHALKYLGEQNALLLRDAKKVLLVQLRPLSKDQDAKDGSWNVNGQLWRVEQQVDVTHRAGVLYVRESLLYDSTYDWQAPPQDCQSNLLYALVFQSGTDRLELIFDPDCQTMRAISDSTRSPISIAPAITFFKEWLKQQSPP